MRIMTCIAAAECEAMGAETMDGNRVWGSIAATVCWRSPISACSDRRLLQRQVSPLWLRQRRGPTPPQTIGTTRNFGTPAISRMSITMDRAPAPGFWRAAGR